MAKVKPKPAPKKPPPAKPKPKGKGKYETAKTASGKVDYKSPAALAKYDSDSAAILNDLRAEVRENESKWLGTKKLASEQKKEYEVSVNRLMEKVEERQKYRGQQPKAVQKTLTDLPPVADAEPPKAAVESAAKALPAATVPGWYPDDLWKKFPLSDWKGVTAKDLECLASGKAKKGDSFSPIVTVGDLKQFVEPYANNPGFTRNYGDIQGIGAAGATRISDAELVWWGEWNNGGAEAFAMKQGFSPDKKAEVNADSAKPTPATGSGDPTASVGAGADGATPAAESVPSAKPKGKPKSGKKLRGGTNAKPLPKLKKP